MLAPDPIDTEAITALLEAALLENETDAGQEKIPPAFPGAVWAVGDADGITERGQLGVLDPAEPDRPMQPDTLFDLASLTKITAVWSVIGHLWDQGTLTLDDRLDRHLPESIGHPHGAITVRQLLTHTAGVPARASLWPLYQTTDPDEIRRRVLQEDLEHEPGTKAVYTDRAALILGYLAEQLAGRRHRLDLAASELVWQPLGMKQTAFGPLPAAHIARCAPTELDPETGLHVRGSAHDYSARLLGGVCGVAGAFGPIDDLALFAQHMLAPDRTPEAFSADWIKLSLQIHTGDLITPPRGLFWHTAPETNPAHGIWVHYGFTGGGLWICPSQRRWASLMTNGLYYGRRRPRLTEVRNSFRALIFS